MRRASVAIAVFAVVVLALPAQAGIEDQLQVSFRGDDASPGEVHGLDNTLYFGDEGEQIRQEADEDGDGTVSDAERDAYVASVESKFEQSPPELEWTLDGVAVSTPEDPRVDSQGLNTTIDDSQTVSIQVEFNATFDGVSHGNEHELVVPEFQECRGAGGAGFPPEWSVGFMDDHSVESVNVETNRVSDRVAAVPCQDGDPPELRVVFSSAEPVEDPGSGSDVGSGESGDHGDAGDGQQSSPGPGALLGIAGGLVGALLVSRRR